MASQNLKKTSQKIFVVLSVAAAVFFYANLKAAAYSASSKTDSAQKAKPATTPTKAKAPFRAPLSENEAEALGFKKEARIYRAQGLSYQRSGDLDSAMMLYQKAIVLDPLYADPHNDLGVIYESEGDIERAQKSYLEAVKIDPSFLSAYTNLALLYENKRDLQNAAFYWGKRASLGIPGDAWTEKAKNRLRDIGLVLNVRPYDYLQEQEVSKLVREVDSERQILKKDDKKLAEYYLDQAKVDLERGDDLAALKKSINALQLDPTNTEIEEFAAKIQKRILLR